MRVANARGHGTPWHARLWHRSLTRPSKRPPLSTTVGLAEIVPKLAEIAQCRSMSATEIRPKSGPMRPRSPNFVRFRPTTGRTLGRFRLKSSICCRLGKSLAELGETSANINVAPTSQGNIDRNRPSLPNLCPNRLRVAEIGPRSAEIVDVGRSRQNMAESGSGQFEPEPIKFKMFPLNGLPQNEQVDQMSTQWRVGLVSAQQAHDAWEQWLERKDPAQTAGWLVLTHVRHWAERPPDPADAPRSLQDRTDGFGRRCGAHTGAPCLTCIAKSEGSSQL